MSQKLTTPWIKFTNKSDSFASSSGWCIGSTYYRKVIIKTLDGNDTITGTTTDWNYENPPSYTTKSSFGILNFGEIDTGNGNDAITGTSNNNGGGTGIYNSGTIKTGNDNDTITGIGYTSYSTGIFNTGTIDTGNGNDTIKGACFRWNYYPGSIQGIVNTGTINTGDGNDSVDALEGGFFGNGVISLGTGNDILKGFGSGIFKGDAGNDRIIFGNGAYTVNGGIISSGGVMMNVTGFEQIAGINGGLFTFTNGVFNVNQNGIMTKV